MSRPEVLDASALLALLQREAGGEAVKLTRAVMNSVNFAEVMQKSVAKGRAVDTLLQELMLLGDARVSCTSLTSCDEAELTRRARQVSKASDTALILLPLPRLVAPTAEPFFSLPQRYWR